MGLALPFKIGKWRSVLVYGELAASVISPLHLNFYITIYVCCLAVCMLRHSHAVVGVTYLGGSSVLEIVPSEI